MSERRGVVSPYRSGRATLATKVWDLPQCDGGDTELTTVGCEREFESIAGSGVTASGITHRTTIDPPYFHWLSVQIFRERIRQGRPPGGESRDSYLCSRKDDRLGEAPTVRQPANA